MDKAKLLLISSFVGAFFCFSFSIAILLVAGKSFCLETLSDSKSGYKGDGQSHIWKISYGTTIEGLFSASAYVGLVVYHVQSYKAPTRERFEKLQGMTVFATMMMLQAAIAYGNEALTANELKVNEGNGLVTPKNDYNILENCGTSEFTLGSVCDNSWQCVGDNCPNVTGTNVPLQLHVRNYQPNTKIKGPANAAVTFAVFMFFLSIFQAYFLNQNLDEIAGGGGGGGQTYSNSGAENPAPATSAGSAGEGYQRL